MSPIEARPGRAAYWTGWTLSGLLILFLAPNIVIKLIGMPVVEETLTGLGYPPGLGVGIGVMEAVILVLYAIPRTSILGAVLMTGLMGGAMASHLRAESPLFSHLLFGLYLGLFVWGGLWLRDARLRTIFPFRRTQKNPSAAS